MNIYDFDHTIYNGDSSVDFWLFALCRKPYLVVFLPLQIYGTALFLLGIYSKERMKEAFFIFIRHVPLDKMTANFWERNRSKIKPWYLRQKQDSDVIISASPAFLLEPVVCGYLGVALIASRIDTNTGKYIGKNCFGKEKITRLYEIYPDCIIESFYSDSYTDTALARLAKKAFFVRKATVTEWAI